MAITQQQLANNLKQARRSSRVSLSEAQKQEVREMRKDTSNRPVLCMLYGLSYQELKDV